MNILSIAALLLGIGPYWSIAPDGSLIVVTPLAVVEIAIDEPPPTGKVVRIPGPRHAWPHGSCLMCLGNHAAQRHGYNRTYLDSIGSKCWGTLHDNAHNTAGFRHNAQPRGEGYYSGGATTRRRFFGRWRRR